MSEHWYTREGAPAYEVPSKSGALRPATLADARKLGLVPSVTTVLAIKAKPQLEAWKVRQGILAALTLPRPPGEAEADWLARIEADSREQARKAAEEGTRIHDAIERRYKGLAVPEDYRAHVDAACAEVARLFPGVDDWIAEASFACADGYGGKVDLHSPSTGIIVDFKGKDGDFSDEKRLAYDQNEQLAAYQRGLGLKRAPCANVFISRTHAGCVASKVWTPSEIEAGERVFLAALALWKAVNRYDPSSAPAAHAAAPVLENAS